MKLGETAEVIGTVTEILHHRSSHFLTSVKRPRENERNVRDREVSVCTFHVFQLVQEL